MSLQLIVDALIQNPNLSSKSIGKLIKKYPIGAGGFYSRAAVIQAYRERLGADVNLNTLKNLRLKPIRSLSGVTPVTVLTKPWACPGDCIFCPSDIKMPKSYLSNEPGAQRAANNFFDPYLQAYNRLTQLHEIGHPIDKVEYIILGGTWSVYPLPYRIWFIKRLFEALNDFGQGIDQSLTIKPSINTSHVPHVYADAPYNRTIAALYKDQELIKLKQNREVASWEDLEQQQKMNVLAKVRCVGLVLETRPDYIDIKEATCLRRLGCTKVQIGVQTLNNRNLRLNKRGHTVAETRAALNLLRRFGFKLHIHWMPNLLGATPSSDKTDYLKLYTDSSIKPDEIKIYPTSLIPHTKLVQFYERGEWQPYTHQELLDVLTFSLMHTPRYTRITRMVRDIPSPDIMVGNKLTNFRQIAQRSSNQTRLKDIRAREIRNTFFDPDSLKFKQTKYTTKVSTEYFMEYITPEDKIVAFLRLSLPLSKRAPLPELNTAAIIREVHVYGQMTNVSQKSTAAPQHLGLGKKLIQKAIAISRKTKYQKLSVISAIGTRQYYQKIGFVLQNLYQHYPLS